ncbi:hypothetical protein RV134_310293 [Roseovarius sp. EC-HK134]|nr:hypothetical protein RV134_310293 [Roseovarius sp. EC-HK134]
MPSHEGKSEKIETCGLWMLYAAGWQGYHHIHE